MKAIEKINAIGVPVLKVKTGRSASIIYRWRKALTAGEGIRDANKRALIHASAETDHPITWEDFAPQRAA